jgi:hypothetical protein
VIVFILFAILIRPSKTADKDASPDGLPAGKGLPA